MSDKEYECIDRIAMDVIMPNTDPTQKLECVPDPNTMCGKMMIDEKVPRLPLKYADCLNYCCKPRGMTSTGPKSKNNMTLFLLIGIGIVGLGILAVVLSKKNTRMSRYRY
jgi:hypothetical protein